MLRPIRPKYRRGSFGRYRRLGEAVGFVTKYQLARYTLPTITDVDVPKCHRQVDGSLESRFGVEMTSLLAIRISSAVLP